MLEVNKKNIRIWSMLGMRRMVGLVMQEIAAKDPKFLFATADLGRYFGINDLQMLWPDKVVDFGIAEQNLIGAATGLQKEGFHVWAATYATFITARALDQIRVNLGLMGFSIRLIGAAGGLSDGNFSATHMALEDVADIRAIPNISIIEPADGVELVKAMQALQDYDKPAYIRLTGRANTPIIYKDDFDYRIGKAVTVRPGKDIAIIAAGTILATALTVADDLEKVGISCQVVDMSTIKPLDEAILNTLVDRKLVVTVEEHMKAGGLGSSIAEYFAEKKDRPRMLIIAIDDCYPQAAEYEDLLIKCGLSRNRIFTKIQEKYLETID